MASTETSHEAHAAHNEHSDRFYWMVALVLAVVTGIEVGFYLAYQAGMIPKWFEVTVLLILSLIKGVGIVAYFMHLKGDAKIYQFIFIVPLSFAVTLLLVFRLLFSGWVGVAG